MGTEFVPALDAAARAALENGKPLVYVCPPAAWAAAPLLATAGTGTGTTVVLVPDEAAAWDARRVLASAGDRHPPTVVTGRARAERSLRAGAHGTILITPADALALVGRATLKLHDVRLLVLWPEAMRLAADGDALEELLAAAQGAQRLFVTTDLAGIADLVERHAYRAPVAVASTPPPQPSGAIRFATVGPPGDVVTAARQALDQLNPDSAFIWDPIAGRDPAWEPLRGGGIEVGPVPGADPVQLAIAAECVSHEVLEALRAMARDVLVLVRADQVPYLEQLATLRPLPRPGEADRARNRAHALRAEVRDRLEAGGLDAELLALAPLFQEFDPSVVAAAAAALMRRVPGGAPSAPVEAWTRIHINVGRADRVGPGDIVGVLGNVVGIAKADLGRIDIRDRFAIVEIRPGDVDAVVRGLTGTEIRGRRATARLDRA